jgi:hypothetical protein
MRSMTSFDAELQAATRMALELWDLRQRTSGIGHNHGPSADDFDPAVFVRLDELPRLLATTLAQLDRDHRAAWCAFLDDAERRLRAVAESQEDDHRLAAYLLERWKSLASGELAAEALDTFAMAAEVLARDRPAPTSRRG